jgi:Protein of unknown function (DUF1800)
VAATHALHVAPSRGKDGAVLARTLYDRCLQSEQRQYRPDAAAHGHLSGPGVRQFSRPSIDRLERLHDVDLAGRPLQPQGCAQRELRSGTDGAVHARDRQLLRGRCQSRRPRLYRLDIFNAKDHDDGQKTFLGQTGNFNGDDIIDILAGHPATATFLATKLARFLVSDPPDDELVQALAETYLSSNYEIRPVLRALFKSDAFSHPSSHRALVKSPAEYVVGTLRTLDIRTDGTALPPIMGALGQELFNPPNVAGWPGGPAWIATNTMLTRNNMANSIAVSTTPESGWWTDLKRTFGLPQTPTASELVNAIVEHLVDGDLSSVQRARLFQYLERKPSDRVDLARDDLKVRGLLYLTLTLPIYQMN